MRGIWGLLEAVGERCGGAPRAPALRRSRPRHPLCYRRDTRHRGSVRCMPTDAPALLPLLAEDVERTCRPRADATMLPRAAYVDPAILEWELRHLFLGGWICAGHVD